MNRTPPTSVGGTSTSKLLKVIFASLAIPAEVDAIHVWLACRAVVEKLKDHRLKRGGVGAVGVVR